MFTTLFIFQKTLTIGIQPKVYMSLNEVNDLFYLLENPTRRRILELLSREGHYPLQLSKEMSVTQQAVVKHLNILEEHGLVNSETEPSNRGPSRRVYYSTRSISLHVDVSPSTFKEQAHSSSEHDAILDLPKHKHMMDAINSSRKMDLSQRANLLDRVSKDIEKSLKDTEDERKSLIHLTNLVNQELYKITIESKCTYDERRLLYFSIQNPNFTIEKAASSLGMDDSAVRILFDALHRKGLIK